MDELEEEFFRGKVYRIAEELVGKKLVDTEKECSGKIVETEAYLGRADPVSHLVKAGEERRKTFEKGAGTVYVFKIYQHSNFNVITEREGLSEGILVRALEPVSGLEEMKDRRGVEDVEKLCSGPGKLCQAMGIEREVQNGEKLSESCLKIVDTGSDPEIIKTPRIGISSATHWPLRFTERNNPYVSRRKPAEDLEYDWERLY